MLFYASLFLNKVNYHKLIRVLMGHNKEESGTNPIILLQFNDNIALIINN